MTALKVTWVDHHREPKHPPNSRYPNGIDLDLARDAPGCVTALPYPTPRCGLFYVECKTCGANVVITTAGRTDDPRSVKIACHRNGAQ